MYRIMLADDEGIVIESLKFIIQKEFGNECIIESAKTGRNVIELAEQFRPDIAFMDIKMPGINGIDAMKEIRKTNTSVQFIVMSAYDKFDYAKESINLGVLEYLNKPVDRNKIIAVINKAMKIIDKDRKARSRALQIKEKMETVVPIIENSFVYSLLFQGPDTDEIDNFKNLLELENNYCSVAILQCGEENIGNQMTNSIGSSVRLQRQFSEVREIIKENLGGIVSSVMANEIVIIIPSEDNILEYNERSLLIEKARNMLKDLRKRVDASFRIGFGQVVSLGEAGKSYIDAKQALQYIESSVAHVDDVSLGCDYEENYPIDIENEIFKATKKGNVEAQKVSVEKFYDWMVANYSDTVIDIKTKVLEFVLRAETIGYEASSKVYRFCSRHDYIPTIMAYDNFDALKEWFVDKMNKAAYTVACNKEQAESDVISVAKKYILSNYQKDISLDDVSREVDISSYYFSKLFKEAAGENFIEYLTNIRIDKAKELLQGKEKTIKEVCAEVGYADPNYFSRAFKKKVGVTPTEYREENL
ncbi:MAG: response regulator [Lachnospiraceae bacterium]|nr:response regulator [Lachnospiraceae bacterium]